MFKGYKKYILFGIFALIVVVLLFLLFYKTPKGMNYFGGSFGAPSGDGAGSGSAGSGDNSAKAPSDGKTAVNIAKRATSTPFVENDRDQVERIAKYFAERFGSYSNQSNFSNLNDSSYLMTKKMSDWANGYLNDKVAENRKAKSAFYNISTKAVAVNMEKFQAGGSTAEVTVQTRRNEVDESKSTEAKNFYQNLNLVLVKEGGIWKVDKAFWLNK